MSGGTRSGELASITMLDLAGIGPSPRCLRVLADLGARWVRLSPPAREQRLEPRWHHYGALRGVERFELDLKRPEARGVFLRLAAQADVVVESFRPGVAARLGIGYEDARAVNERIVYCSISGYGQTGPYAGAAGHDLNYQALSGALAAIGRCADGSPALPGLTLADSAGGGWQAALRIMAALIARQSTGAGAYLDVSAAEGVVHLMSVAIDEYLAGGTAAAPERTMLNGRYACYAVYGTADGGWLAVAAIEPKFFATLCDVLDAGGLAGVQYDDASQPEIRRAFAAAFAKRTRAEWETRLAGLDVCVTPVLSVEDVTRDEHWAARGMFAGFDHPRGPARQVRPFGTAAPENRGRPATASEPEAVLGTFGFRPEEIAELRLAGTVQ